MACRAARSSASRRAPKTITSQRARTAIGIVCSLMPKAAWSSRNSRETRMFFGYNGLWGLLILAGDIWAIINIFQSSVSNEKKLLWTLVVLLLPVLGLILWFFLGPRDRQS